MQYAMNIVIATQDIPFIAAYRCMFPVSLVPCLSFLWWLCSSLLGA